MDTRSWRLARGGRTIETFPDLAAAARWVNASRFRTVILDVEPALVHWDEPAPRIVVALQELKSALSPGPRILLCTNSARFSGVIEGEGLVSRARKPWTSSGRLSGARDHAVVIGDLLCLDGLLAARLGCDFAWIKSPIRGPAWPRFLAAVDRVLAPLLLRRMNGTR
jgi:predicted HAD superfamily phosphohydrolase YqeG